MKPKIIPRKEHCISRRQISPNALRTLYRLHNNGFIAYLVGGCVRDLLMERRPKDFDIGTDALPRQIKRLFRNCFLIGRRFRLAHLRFQDEILEVATFRRADSHFEKDDAGENNDNHTHVFRRIRDEDGMVLRDNVFGSPEEDALCRDFTINALAYNIADFSVIDYSTGLNDLQQRIIRPIGDPSIRFTEDPVRMLRAVRFSASHDFVIEPSTWERLCEMSSTITRVAKARLYEEIQKLFLLGYARPGFSLLNDSGLLTALFPGLSKWIYGSSDRLAFLEKNLECLDDMFRNGKSLTPVLFLAALFGPTIEASVLARHRDGIPLRQALDNTCSDFIKEAFMTAGVPGKTGKQLYAILGLQHHLHRIPPKRPASIAGRPEFANAIEYLRLTAETRNESRSPLEWWDAFLRETPLPTVSEPSTDGTRVKQRKKRRRRYRRNNSSPAQPEK